MVVNVKIDTIKYPLPVELHGQILEPDEFLCHYPPPFLLVVFVTIRQVYIYTIIPVLSMTLPPKMEEYFCCIYIINDRLCGQCPLTMRYRRWRSSMGQWVPLGIATAAVNDRLYEHRRRRRPRLPLGGKLSKIYLIFD